MTAKTREVGLDQRLTPLKVRAHAGVAFITVADEVFQFPGGCRPRVVILTCGRILCWGTLAAILLTRVSSSMKSPGAREAILFASDRESFLTLPVR